MKGRKGAKEQRGLPRREAVGQDLVEGDALLGREEQVDDFFGVREVVVAAAPLDVPVEEIQGVQAEAGVNDLADADKGVGLGLLLFGGDFPEFGYLVCHRFEDDGGDDAGVLALEGLELAAEVLGGDSRGYKVNIFLFSGHFRSFPVIV